MNYFKFVQIADVPRLPNGSRNDIAVVFNRHPPGLQAQIGNYDVQRDGWLQVGEVAEDAVDL